MLATATTHGSPLSPQRSQAGYRPRQPRKLRSAGKPASPDIRSLDQASESNSAQSPDPPDGTHARRSLLGEKDCELRIIIHASPRAPAEGPALGGVGPRLRWWVGAAARAARPIRQPVARRVGGRPRPRAGEGFRAWREWGACGMALSRGHDLALERARIASLSLWQGSIFCQAGRSLVVWGALAADGTMSARAGACVVWGAETAAFAHSSRKSEIDLLGYVSTQVLRGACR